MLYTLRLPLLITVVYVLITVIESDAWPFSFLKGHASVFIYKKNRGEVQQ